MSSKTKIITLVVIALMVGLVVFLVKKDHSPEKTSQPEQTNKIVVVSTDPSPLEEATILPTQKVQIKFNKPMVNDPARITLEPVAKINATVIGDHTILEVTPLEPLKLGQDYTLTIKDGYSSDTGEKLEGDLLYHFKTIQYNGV